MSGSSPNAAPDRGRPVFLYDFNSPYAYFAAHRVDEVLGVPATWTPIAFGFLLAATGRVPWSLGPEREAGQRECERRAAELGLPLRWPAGWPRENWSLLLLRAALVAEDHGRLREFSTVAFRHGLGEGRDLRELEAVLGVGADAGVPEAAIRDGVRDPTVKDRLKAATDAAVARGVIGIPTVAVAGRLFWGEDRLADAAREMAWLAGPGGRSSAQPPAGPAGAGRSA